MRGSFVLRLGPDTKPDQGKFEGWVGEVDSGQELRFHSTEELLKFLGQRFKIAFDPARRAPEPSQADAAEPDLASEQPNLIPRECLD